MGEAKKFFIVRAIDLLQQTVAEWNIQIQPQHIAEIVLAWEHGYAVRWNPKYYVRPFIPEDNGNIIEICEGNPKPNPGPFRIMCLDIETKRGKLTEIVNAKIKDLSNQYK